MTCERIASLLASGTEILYALGLGDRVVAISHECDFPPEVTAKPRVTRTTVSVEASSRSIDEEVRALVAERLPIYRIDVELLEGLAPDLIVTQSQCDVCAIDYQDVAAVVATRPGLRHARIVAMNPTTLDAIFDDIRRVADAAGCAERGTALIASLQSRLERIRARTAGLRTHERPRVACLEWLDPPMVAANWMPELVEFAGGLCPLTRTGDKSTYANWGQVVAFDPEVIVLMPCGFDLQRTIRESRVCRSLPHWDGLAAVRTRRVYAVDGNAYFNRSGPRIVDSLEILATLIHPDLFEGQVDVPADSWQQLPGT